MECLKDLKKNCFFCQEELDGFFDDNRDDYVCQDCYGIPDIRKEFEKEEYQKPRMTAKDLLWFIGKLEYREDITNSLHYSKKLREDIFKTEILKKC